MKRGDLWIASGGGDYTGKPRPVVIVQDDRFEQSSSVTVCALTSDPTDAPLFRRERLSRRIGSLSPPDMRQIDRAILVFLGIAG